MRTCVCNPAALKAAEELHARSKGYSTSIFLHSPTGLPNGYMNVGYLLFKSLREQIKGTIISATFCRSLSLSNTGTADCPRQHHSFGVRWQRIAARQIEVGREKGCLLTEQRRRWLNMAQDYVAGNEPVDHLLASSLQFASMSRTASSLASDLVSYGSSASKSECPRQQVLGEVSVWGGLVDRKNSSKCERGAGSIATAGSRRSIAGLGFDVR
jgi:hypothetical protein